MKVHPGDLIQWRGANHHVVLVRPSYLTLRPSDGGEDVEILAADLQYEVESVTPLARPLAELRNLDDIDDADRKVIDVWL